MTAPTALRDQGWADVQAADVAPHRLYADLIRAAVDAQPGQFTSDEIHEWIAEHHPGREPHSPNLIGSILGSLACAGRIEAIGLDRTHRRSGRARRILIFTRTQ